MKKLMTTVSAVAVAFGLYAADTGTSFEGLGAGPYDINDTTGELVPGGSGAYWATNGTETLTVVADTSSIDENNRPANFALLSNQKYLSIKTTLGSPVKRNVTRGGTAALLENGDFYFDSLVKFTAFEGDQTVNLDGGKLAIWLRENLDANDNPTSTNLMITAGYLDSENNAVATNYECSVSGDLAGTKFNDGGWHRVTVKAINAIYNGQDVVNGFVVFIDGSRVKTGISQSKGIDSTKLKDFAYFEHVDAEGALFPSAVQDGLEKGKIASVAFDGQGDVDDILFTSTAPTFAATKDYFTINAGANVASVGYVVAGEGGASGTVQAGGSAVVEYVAGMSITITPTYSAGCAAGTWEGVQPDGNVVEPTDAGQYVTVVGATARASVSHGGVDTPYPTLAAAFAAINANEAGAGPFTVTLNSAATAGISLATNATVVLDLAGNNITGVANEPAISVTAGTLLVTNSTVEVGRVIGTADPGEDAVAVSVENGSVTLAGGYYLGQVSQDADIMATVAGIEMNSNTLSDLNNQLEAGYEFVAETTESPVFYVVQALPTYVAQIGAQKYETFAAALAAAADGDTITLLDDVTAARFQIAADKFTAQGLTIDLGGYTYTFNTTTEAKDAIELLKGNKLTIANGTLAAVADSSCRDVIRDYDSDLTLTNVTFNGANFPAKDGAKLACLLCVEGGDVDIVGSTSFINVKSESYAIKMGNHAQNYYVMGTTTVNTTGNIEGNVLIAGGVYNEVAVGSGSTINYYYGKNVHSSWEDGVSSDEFAARTGTLPTAAGTQDNVSGQLFKQFTDAIAVTNEFTLLADYDGDVTFTMDTQITANGHELTGTLTAPAGYKVGVVDGVYQALQTYTITYMYENELTGLTPATYTIGDAVTLPSEVDLGVVGVSFVAWTNAEGQVVANWAAGAKTGNQTFYAQTAPVVVPPSGLAPGSNVTNVTITAASAEAAVDAVEITPPTGSGISSAEDIAAYKALFNIEATAGATEGTFDVAITGFAAGVETGVETSAVALLTSGSGTVAVPAGLYYKITPSTALPISGTAEQGLSDGTGVSVTKPGTTQGFLKVELSATPFAQE